jgi:K+-transporting ATPase ATPase C chain
MLQHLRPAIATILLMSLFLGVAYPLIVTGIAQIAFPARADGSLVRNSAGQIVGSELIGQAFAGPQYLHPRPSAAGAGYDAAASSGSNYGPLNEDLQARVTAEAERLRAEAPDAALPADAVTASGSGLDPHISPEYARLQAPRIAAARDIPVEAVQAAIDARTEGRLLGFIGQPRVNVLLVNLDLDVKQPMSSPPPS